MTRDRFRYGRKEGGKGGSSEPGLCVDPGDDNPGFDGLLGGIFLCSSASGLVSRKGVGRSGRRDATK